MSNRRLLTSRLGGTYREWVHIDPNRPDDLTIEREQDCTQIMEAASILADEPPGKEFRLAALIPEWMLADAMCNGWLHDRKKWKQVLNDPSNARFRVWKGRL